jgi:uncharacterized membrane protein YeaQ/YmgE (transglycosylase-associated protein family)
MAGLAGTGAARSNVGKETAMVGALILGLLAGFIAKALMPGKDPGGFFVTILLGLVGAFVGWIIFTKALGIGDDDIFDLGGLIGAIVGTMVVLFAYRQFAAREDGTAGRPAV